MGICLDVFEVKIETKSRTHDHQTATCYCIVHISRARVTGTPHDTAMNLSSLVHTGIHQMEPQYTAHAPRTQQIMVSSLMADRYAVDQRPHTSYTYVTAPQPPPSPPVDEASKFSLPPISSLLRALPNNADSKDDSQSQASQQQGMQCCHSIQSFSLTLNSTTNSKGRIQTKFKRHG